MSADTAKTLPKPAKTATPKAATAKAAPKAAAKPAASKPAAPATEAAPKAAEAVIAEIKAEAQAISQSVAAKAEAPESPLAGFAAPNKAVENSFAQVAAITQSVRDALGRHGHGITSYENIMSLAQQNTQAMTEATQVWTSGLHQIASEWAELSQKVMAENMELSRRLAGVKSLHEAMDIQSEAARHQLDQMIQMGLSLNNDSLKLAESAFGPLGERLTATLDKLTKS